LDEVRSALKIAYQDRYIGSYDSMTAALHELLHKPKIGTTKLKQRGWTDKLIAAFLPEPTLCPNPHGYAHQMRLWLIDDVRSAEEIIKAELLKNRRRKHGKSLCDVA
jgi:hypothetical protein